MEWAYIVVYVLIGALIGYIIAQLTAKNSDQAEIKTELDKTKSELNQHRQELVDHFANSAELLENIYRDYSKLCQIMAKTSTDLLPEQSDKDNPFAKRLAHTLEKEPIELKEAPRDYSETSSGLLKGESALPKTEEKEKEKEPQLVTEEKKEKELTEKVE